jgi:Kef-type K+ transport system membrane component KefB
MMPHLPTLLIQIVVILLSARLAGWLFRTIEQPTVMGEMVAGILLGPSLLGWVAPGVSAALFPAASLGFLNSLSQIGLLLFMFLVGVELNPQILRGRKHAAVVTSHVSIIVPFFLGTLLALYLYPRLSDDSVAFTHFALFVGTAMSITAFPVLARILRERNLIHSEVGAVAIACAAVDDVTAWCMLAGVVLLVRASSVVFSLWLTLSGTVVYVGLTLLVTRRALSRLLIMYRARAALTQDLMGVIVLVVLASSWITERLGIHALFGAFLIGVIMPKDQEFVRAIRERLEGLTVVLLLPLYFAFTGLRMSVGFLSGADMWFFCGIIMVVAVAGKFGGACLGARLSGMPWREGECDRIVNEHARIDGIGRLKYRTRYRSHLAGALYHDGPNGAGDHLYDNAFAETGVSDTRTLAGVHRC